MAKHTDEYPKTFDVPFLAPDDVDNAVIAFYSLITADVTRPEVTLYAKKKPSFRDSFRYAIYPVVLSVSKGSPSTFEQFKKDYEEHRAGISAVVSLDKKDKLRLNITFSNEDSAREAGLPAVAAVTVYDSKSEELLPEFFAEWESKFLALRDTQN